MLKVLIDRAASAMAAMERCVEDVRRAVPGPGLADVSEDAEVLVALQLSSVSAAAGDAAPRSSRAGAHSTTVRWQGAHWGLAGACGVQDPLVALEAAHMGYWRGREALGGPEPGQLCASQQLPRNVRFRPCACLLRISCCAPGPWRPWPSACSVCAL